MFYRSILSPTKTLMIFKTILTKLTRILDFLHLKNSELMTCSLFLIATDTICALKYSRSLAPGTFYDKSIRCYLGKQQMLFGAKKWRGTMAHYGPFDM